MKYRLQLFVTLLLPMLAAAFVGSRYAPIEIPSLSEAAVMESTVTGYTIYQRSQVSPQYISVTDSTGSMDILNPGPTPDYPPTFGVKLCYSTPFDLYGPQDSRRLEVWQDALGVATVGDILAICPQFGGVP